MFVNEKEEKEEIRYMEKRDSFTLYSSVYIILINTDVTFSLIIDNRY